MLENQVSRFSVVTAPSAEPVTLEEAKRQCRLSLGDDNHDQDLLLRIQAAREQWEHDTDSAVMTQTLSVTIDRFENETIYLPRRPVRSVSSIVYYTANDTIATVSASDYSLDAPNRAIRLKANKLWPTTYDRWDAVKITYIAGFASRQLVPAIAKQAILLLVNYYFAKNLGDWDGANDMRAYERLVDRFMRPTYP
jgi:uncharacterized phiE125 gp8 family phage protein